MFVRILLKSFRHRDSRQLVALLSVVAATAVAAALLTITTDIGKKINVELRAYGANMLLISKNIESHRTITIGRIAQHKWPASLRGVAPVLYGIVNLFSDSIGTVPEPVVALGTDLDAMQKVNPFWKIEPPMTRLNDSTMLAGEAAARKFGLTIGQSITLRATATDSAAAFRVAGVVRTGEGEDDQLIISLLAMQRLLALPGRATLVLASVHGGPKVVQKLAAEISQNIPEINAKPLRQIAESEGHLLRVITFLMTAVTAFTVIIATLCLGTTMTAMIVERRQEVGMMKAIGAANHHIGKLIAAELTVLGISGGLLGYGIGAVFAHIISKNVFNTAVALRLDILPAVMLLALGISLTAMIFPLRSALHMAPAVTLRGE